MMVCMKQAGSALVDWFSALQQPLKPDWVPSSLGRSPESNQRTFPPVTAPFLLEKAPKISLAPILYTNNSMYTVDSFFLPSFPTKSNFPAKLKLLVKLTEKFGLCL